MDIETIALEVAEEVGIQFDKRYGTCYTGNTQITRFAKALVERLTRDAEPVAVRWRPNNQWGWSYSTKELTDELDGFETEPLFLHPPLAQQVPEEKNCSCDRDFYLAMYSGGAAPERLYGRLTMYVEGRYVDYFASAPKPEKSSNEEVPCSTHPDAPHGFCRTSSHSLGRYVCECEGWEPEESK